MPHRTVLFRSDRSQGHARGALAGDDRRGHEYHELAPGLADFLLLEEPAKDGDVAEDRNLAHGTVRNVLGDPADDEAVARLDQDLGLRLALVDGWDGDASADVDGKSPRVVLHEHDHLDLVDHRIADLLPEHARHDIELEHRLLELDLRPGRAHGGVGDFLAERDRGLGVLHCDDLRAGQRARLALIRESLQRQVDVELARHEAEGDSARGRALDGRAWQGLEGQIDDVAPEGQAGAGGDRKEVVQVEIGIPRVHQGRGGIVQNESIRLQDACLAGHEEAIVGVYHALEALADDGGLLVDVARARAAPLDADALVGAAVENLHPRLDLDLGQRHVEALADQLLDALDVSLIVADEDAVGRLVRLDRDALGQHILADRDNRRRLRDGNRRVGSIRLGQPAECRIRRADAGSHDGRVLRDAENRRRGNRHGPGRRYAEDALEGLGDVLGVGVGETDRLLFQGTTSLGFRDGGVGLKLLCRGLRLLELRIGPAGARIRLRLDEGVLHAGLRLALLRQLLRGDDANDAVAIETLETSRLENGVEGLFPGDVVERDGDLALDVVAGHDVAPALCGEDSQQVGNVRVFEVEGDELATAPRGLAARQAWHAGGRWRRRRRRRRRRQRRGWCRLRAWRGWRTGRRGLCNPQGNGLGLARRRWRQGHRGHGLLNHGLSFDRRCHARPMTGL